MAEFDYSDFRSDSDDENLLQLISDTADNIRSKELEIAQLEEKTSKANKEYRLLVEDVLPSLMEKAKMKSFTTESGLVVEVREDVRASLSKERAGEGCQWLRDHGHDSIIKTQVVAEFMRGNDDAALDFYREASKLNSAEAKLTSTVHPQTLTSFVKERLAAGEVMPVDLFKISRMLIAKVKESRKK